MSARRIPFMLLILSSALMAPQRVLALNPIANESRAVRAAADSKKSVTVIGGMVWYDGNPASHGLRFPPGVYVLEAEDDDYFYFRSPNPLEFRIFKNGSVVDGREIPGGLMLSKHAISMIPGAGYIDGVGPAKKLMIWKLGGNFLRLKGENWRKSF